MNSVIITSKGRITIPAGVRKALKISSGDRVELIEIEPGRYAFLAATHSIADLKGLFGKPANAVSIGQMNHDIARSGAGQFKKSPPAWAASAP